MTRVIDRQVNEGWVDNEVPSGTVNGSNVTFTLAFTPDDAAGVKVYINGLRTKDFSVTGSTITFTTAPATDSEITVDYTKKL